MRIGLIGAGNIGGAVAALAVRNGHSVVLSNSRGPQTLGGLAGRLGPHASAATAAEAARLADLVVVAVPLKHYRQVPVAETEDKPVIDTNNYYPQRDGHIADLDGDTTTSSELLAAHLPGSQVVKALNTMYYGDLASRGQPPGTRGRLAYPMAGNDEASKQLVADLLGQFGYDVVDAGGLAQGRRFQPGTPAYGARLDASGLREALAKA